MIWVVLMTSAMADCMSGSLSAWPAVGAELPADGEVLVQAYGTERATLEKLGDDGFALVQGSDRIALKRVETLHGSFSDDQAVLAPAEAPGPGAWTLHVGGEPLTVWQDGEHQPVRWTFTAVDPEPPTWTGAPVATTSDREYFGCGPGVTVGYRVPVRDTTWLLASVSDGETRTTVRLPVNDGEVRLGHGMCSGLIELDEGRRYTASFVPIGADGTRSADARSVEFVAP